MPRMKPEDFSREVHIYLSKIQHKLMEDLNLDQLGKASDIIEHALRTVYMKGFEHSYILEKKKEQAKKAKISGIGLDDTLAVTPPQVRKEEPTTIRELWEIIKEAGEAIERVDGDLSNSEKKIADLEVNVKDAVSIFDHRTKQLSEFLTNYLPVKEDTFDF